MESEDLFVKNAIRGTVIAIIFSFIILIFATMNILQAIYSVVTIIMVCLSILCIINLLGWEMGISESIGIVILIGFSVDYCVHIAAHYSHNSYTTR